MRKIFYIFKKECINFFNSPVAYIIISIFVFISGYFFYTRLSSFVIRSFDFLKRSGAIYGFNATQQVLIPFANDISLISLLILPAITMRLFSEEKKMGTLDLLFSYPVSDMEIILGKYLASIFIYLIILFLTLVCPVILIAVSTVDYGTLLSCYLGITLQGMCFLSLGLFASSQTENQIVAVIATLGGLLGFWTIGWGADYLDRFTLARFVRHISISEHFQRFSQGYIFSGDIIYFVNFTLFFLFLTKISVRIKTWR